MTILIKNLFQGVKKILLLLIFQLLLSTNVFAYSPYSTSELDELEKEFVHEINRSDQIIRDPLTIQYINHLGKELSQFAKIPTPYFFIVKSNEINAFAGPGGYIGVNTQLILETSSEHELAAVMAHEIAHVRLHHLYRMIEHQKQMRIPMLASLLASVALGVINPTLGGGAMMASLTGFAQDNINFTRANEKESDRIGIDMLKRSGLDPRGMASFFKKMQQNSRYYYTANIPAILRSHPLDEDRIAEAENRSMNLGNKTYPDHLDYRLFKEFIRTQVADTRRLLDFYHKVCTRGLFCQYGYGLTLLQANKYQEAKIILSSLLQKDNNNLFFQIAMAQAEIGNKEYDAGIKRLEELQANHPENYAALRAYAKGLLDTKNELKASAILLKGSRLFKKDLPLCEELARAQAASNQKSYAYFTEAKCQVLQGRHRDAIRKLKIVSHLAKNDPYLLARSQAMIEEIKFTLEK